MRRAALLLSVLVGLTLLFSACGGGGTTGANGNGSNNPPSAPTGLTATPGNNQVSLTWTAASGATSYNVKRGSTSGGPYTTIGSPATASYTDSTSTNGTQYFYVVTAVNSHGESGNSGEKSATPQTPPPAAPTALNATAGNQQVALTWNASTGATNYNVKRSTTNGGPYTTVNSPTGTSYTNTGLTNFTTYYYVVSAVGPSGEGSNSSQVSAMPITIPAAPAGLTATPGNAQVSLSWTASLGATSYKVKRATVSGGPYSTIVTTSVGTSFVDGTVTNSTPYFYVVTALNSAGESGNSNQASATPAAGLADVTITINPAQTKPISSYIYGSNFYHELSSPPPNLTLDRAGGNRWTAYNWENNFSNAGSDWGPYSNDNFLCNSGCNTATPAEAVRTFIAADHTDGMASLMTIQLQGLVSADGSGLVTPPDPSRFKTVVNKKGAAFTLTPPTNDANVYMDEFLWALDQKFSGEQIFGASPTTHPTFVSLDNEPELWNSTHLEVQGSTPISSDAYITKTINLTQALKDKFPDVVIFGPVHYGFAGIANWQVESFSGGDWFTDKYLRAMKNASTTYGSRLLDVYDFHWYSEARDGATPDSGNRITDLTGNSLTAAQIQAIVQSPRSLWDTTYKENSWIANDVLNGPIYLLGRIQTKIDADWPGTKIAITEYNNGGDNHIAGTIAQADNLGIFGTQGVFAATLWPLTDAPYILAGFRAYRGFDGGNANFGDTSLQATSSDVSKVVVYASTDSTVPGRAVFVAINRSTASKVTAINGLTLAGTATIYQMTASSASGQSPIQPVLVGTQAVNGSSITVTLPALSVTTIQVQ